MNPAAVIYAAREMKEVIPMKNRKAVVLYGSLTGNTEMVGKAMAEVLEEYGFETRCEKITPGKD